MFVGVGYSDTPDSLTAGRLAAAEALQRAMRQKPDLVLLFATARHDAHALRQAVLEVMGPQTAIVGGGAIGVITNDNYGYSGDQVGLAALWFDRARCDLVVEETLAGAEHQAGQRLGQALRRYGVQQHSPVALFYDAIDRSHGDVRLAMATYLLEGLAQGLGFLPDLVGAGLQGDYTLSSTFQWTGSGVEQHKALALAFTGDVQLNHVIMHGCRPATGYYTVTRAEGQTILEINHQPALAFMDKLLQGAVPVEQYPFFLIFGVNKASGGAKWDAFDEKNYASRLCLAIDQERSGIVMFEPDMVEGTEFQIMYRSLELDYMKPRLDALFAELQGRKPVFALYINCGGRAAGYGGSELEDALEVQAAARGKVPLLGMYSGVEIGAVKGRPQGLDWSGVFCLFSIPAQERI